MRAVAWGGALFYAATGTWALVSPTSFYEVLAPFDPLNVHYLRDSGAFSLGLAAVLILALLVDSRALPVSLLGVGIGSMAHDLSHIIDRAAGGRPLLDIPSLGLLGIVLIVAGWHQLRTARRHGAVR